ncbi:cell division protein FtsX [Membranihabitans marinus]|uniref:cell division protein FtsX n=1 Tax=Membranihabitans marinus TaxID=1227546 RepID=UPI001F2159B5|nr:permease-like cell division protein FtsX [Membranihabitans marinus]
MATSKFKPQPNYWLSNVSVTLLLFLAGLLALSWLHSRELIEYLKENVNLTVELDRETGEKEVQSIVAKIQKVEGLKEGSVKLITKEEGFENIKSDFGDDFLDESFPNPLSDMVIMNLQASFVDKDKVDEIKKEINGISSKITQVYFQDQLFDSAIKNMNMVNWALTVFGLLILLIAVFLIHNTIKLALYSNRFLVKTMELVGAKWSFILRPFVGKSLVYGLICGIVAVLMIVLLGFVVYKYYPSIETIFNFQSTLLIIVGVLLLGLLLQGLSTAFVVNKYLRKNMNDLF